MYEIEFEDGYVLRCTIPEAVQWALHDSHFGVIRAVRFSPEEARKLAMACQAEEPGLGRMLPFVIA